MVRVRRSTKAEDRQCRLAEKHERLFDYSPQSENLDNHVDGMSADSFPASNPPSFPSVQPIALAADVVCPIRAHSAASVTIAFS
jgi:hypothetical protein